MADEVLDGPEMVGQLFGECQRVTYHTGDALPQGVVEALNVIVFRAFFVIALCCAAGITPL
jgi:hypothetical protein